MANPDILITPGQGTIGFSGTNTGTIQLRVAESGDIHFEGDQGSLLSLSDDLSDSLFSVNDAAGMPVFEVFADDTIKAYRNNEAKLEIDPDNNRIRLRDNLLISGDLTVSGTFTQTNVSGTSGYFGKVGIGYSDNFHPDARLVVGQNATNGFAIIAGSDNVGVAPQISNSQTKVVRIGMPHYTITEEPVTLMTATSSSSKTDIHIGGGTSYGNSTENMYLRTAASHTTTKGTTALYINNNQEVVVGSLGGLTTAAGLGAALTVSGDASITGTLTVGGGQSTDSIKLIRNSSTSPYIGWYSAINSREAYIQATTSHLYINNDNNANIELQTNGGLNFTVSPTATISRQNVGIGTTNPGPFKLLVSGQNTHTVARFAGPSATTSGGNSYSTVIIGDTDAGSSYGATKDSTFSELQIRARNDAGAGFEAARIALDGYEGRAVGIFFTDDDYQTSKEWFAGMPYQGSAGFWQIGRGTTSNHFAKQRQGAILTVRDEAMGGGNGQVLIGGDARGTTQYAGSTLTVSGDTNITGELRVKEGIYVSDGASAGSAYIQLGNSSDYANFTSAQLHLAGGTNAGFQAAGSRKIFLSDYDNDAATNGVTLFECIDENQNVDIRFLGGSGTSKVGRNYFRGRVGIGTTDPQGVDLHVNGSAIVSGTLYVKNDQIWEDANSTDIIAKLYDNNDDGIFDIYQNNSVVNRIHGNGASYFKGGNVGIGTASPATILEIESADPILQIRDTESTLASAISKIRIGESDGSDAINNAWDICASGEAAGLNLDFIRTNAGTKNKHGITLKYDGKVGIGTASPGSILHLKDPVIGAGGPTITFEDSSGGTQTATIKYDQAGQNTFTFATQYQSANSENKIQFAPADNIAMTVRGGTNTAGNGTVGIGTQTPTGTLHVYQSGDIRPAFLVEGSQGSLFSVEDTLTGSLMSVNDIAGLPVFEAFDDGTIVMGQYNSGDLVVTGNNIGIGTSNPLAKLHLKGSSAPGIILECTTNAQSMNIDYYNNVGAVQSRIGYDEGAGQFSIQPQVSTVGTHVYFKYDGKVGVGLSTPQAKLQVDGDVSITGALRTNTSVGINGANPDSILQINNADSSSYRFGYGGTSDVYLDADDVYFRSDNGGANHITKRGTSIGIGTTIPRAMLHVNGDASITGELSIASLIKHGGDTDTFFGFYSNDRFLVDAGGVQMLDIRNAGTDYVAVGGLSSNAADVNFYVNSATDIGGTAYAFTVDAGLSAVGINVEPSDAKGSAFVVSGVASITGELNVNENITVSANVIANNYFANNYVYHNSDVDCYYGFLKNDHIVFRTAGTDRVLIDDAGHTSITGQLRTNSNCTFGGNISVPAGNIFYLDGGSNSYIYQDSSDSISLATNSVIRWTADNNEFSVNDDSVDMDFRVESNNNSTMLFVDGGTNRVCIGHSSAEGTFDVNGDAIVRGNLYFDGVSSSYIDNLSHDLQLKGAAGVSLWTHVSAGWTERLTVTDPGDVGIGTVLPSGILHAENNGTGIIIANNQITGNAFEVFGAQGNLLTVTDDLSDSLFSVNDAAGMPVFEVFADDTIKSYRNNESKLEIDPDNNRIRLRDNAFVSGSLTTSGNLTVGPSNNSKIYMGGNDYIAFTDAAADGFKFVYDNSERLRLTNQGRLGIGTTDPDSLLTVDGDAQITGSLSIGFQLNVTEKIQHIGDLNTSIDFFGDYIRLVAGGHDMLHVDKGNNEIVLNENSASIDIRMESNSKTNMFFLDGSEDRIGIGTTQPLADFEVHGIISGVKSYSQHARFEHRNNSHDDGGSSVVGYNTRPFNKTIVNNGGFATTGANTFTLNQGLYWVVAETTQCSAEGFLQLRNNSDSAFINHYRSSETLQSVNVKGSSTTSDYIPHRLQGVFYLGSSKTIELQSFLADPNAGDGLGQDIVGSDGDVGSTDYTDDVYAWIEFWKISPTG